MLLELFIPAFRVNSTRRPINLRKSEIMILKSTMTRCVSSALCMGTLLLGLSAPAAAVPLESGLGGTAGYGDLAMAPNDDGSSNLLNLPFNINFFKCL